MNGNLRKFIANNAFRIIILVVGLIVAWTTYQFKIQSNTEAIAGVREDVEEVVEEFDMISESVQKIRIDIAEINTTLKFMIRDK